MTFAARAAAPFRRGMGNVLARLRGAPYLRRWLLLGALIGVVAGLGAALFLWMLQAGSHLLLGMVAGYTEATPAGEGGIHRASRFAAPWAIPLVVAGGMLVAAISVRYLAPEAEGHGTDAALEAVHFHPTRLRGRGALVKMIASALTIGAGGSGGREGPTAQISATFGSVLSRRLALSPADARIAVSAGIAAGIGSIFRAPLGGAILGAELPYRDDVETEALVPSLVASIVGFAVFGAFYGFSPIFGDLGGYRFSAVGDLLFFAAVGVAAGLVGRIYIAIFRHGSRMVRALKLHWAIKPIVAGLAVGGIGLAIPGVLGTGYGDVQQAMLAPVLLGLPLWVVLLLPLAKIVATMLTISSGGVGGIFGPGMVIGAFTGAAVWRLATLTTDMTPASPVPFVIVGMMACFGSIAHAPLAVMLMVAEMTGNLSLLAPAMVAIALATLIVGDRTIYVAQLRNRAALPAHRIAFGLPMAAAVRVTAAMSKPRLVLPADYPAREAASRMAAEGVRGAPLVSAAGRYLGNVRLRDVAALSDRGPGLTVAALVDARAIRLSDQATLDQAVDAVMTSKAGWAPVVDAQSRVIGIMSVSDVVRGYRLALSDATRRIARAGSATAFTPWTVRAGSPADGALVRDLGLPRQAVILTVARGDDLEFVDADTRICAGDRLAILAGRDHTALFATVFGAPDDGAPGERGDGVIGDRGQ